MTVIIKHQADLEFLIFLTLDYSPTDLGSGLFVSSVNAETPKRQHRCKLKKNKKCEEQFGSKKSKYTSLSESNTVDAHVNVAPLPPEIWLKIFGLVVSSTGTLPFLCR